MIIPKFYDNNLKQIIFNLFNISADKVSDGNCFENLRYFRSFFLKSLHLYKYKISKGYYVKICYPTKIDSPSQTKLGNGIFIGPNSWLNVIPCANKTTKLFIDDGTYIGANCLISASNNVHIEKYAMISNNVFISDSYHNFRDINKPIILQGNSSKGPVSIGEGTWIGYGAVILGGVTLGKNCVVGANAVVTKSFPDYSVIAGVPAKIISPS